MARTNGESVALRKESVDRNVILTWFTRSHRAVALRKESVDRNRDLTVEQIASLVALRKESVDRNVNQEENTRKTVCRSPQGERG